MEPIQLQFPWHKSYSNTSPQGSLFCAVLAQAWDDANSTRCEKYKTEARNWFLSNEFEAYCNLINIEADQIQTYAKNLWGEIMKQLHNNSWVFDKRFNLSNVITGLTVAVSIIWWAAQLEKRIAVLEAQFKAFYETQLIIGNL